MLSKRLNCIYDFIDKTNNVADIGADHGLLSIELANANKDKMYLAIENKSGPFLKLKQNVDKKNKYNNICYLKSDGLDDVNEEYKTIIIAGIGTYNIISIIKSNLKKILNVSEIIIDSHKNIPELIDFMYEIGFKVEKCKLIFENNIYYFIFKFIKSNNNDKFTISIFLNELENLNKVYNKLNYLKNIYNLQKLSLFSNLYLQYIVLRSII